MKKMLLFGSQAARTKWAPPLVILLTLAILGITIGIGVLRVRESIRKQMVQREAEVLDAVVMLEQLGAASPEDLAERLGDADGQLALALRLSKLKEGVVAARLYDRDGRFVAAVPVLAKPAELGPSDRDFARRLQPRSKYNPAARLSDYFFLDPAAESGQGSTAPLLSLLIPIHAEGQTNLLAVAELIQQAGELPAAFAVLDRHLARQAALTFGVTGSIISLALFWAFRLLQKTNRRLEEQAASLRRANQELALAAKTSALGAVTAHVLHGLTSPLNGLQNFISAHAGNDADARDALHDTRRMQALVGEIVRILGEQTDATAYELPVSELGEIISRKALALARPAGVRFDFHFDASGVLSNSDANLVMLILENLVQNAIQATPAGRTVRLALANSQEGLSCTVADEGPGLPEAVRQHLFLPCRSTKPGGNGLGLALSSHLARHLEAELRLVRSDHAGSVFALVLPQHLLQKGDDDELEAKFLNPVTAGAGSRA